MRSFYLYKKFKYLDKGIDPKEYSQEAYNRYSKLKLYENLKSQLSEEIIFKVLAVPKSTFYRWKKNYKNFGLSGLENKSKAPFNLPKKKYGNELEELILKIRLENPTWGKKKIAVILKRDYKMISSISTVGRIITKLIKENKIKHSRFYFGRLKNKKMRKFDGHAKRWKYGMKAKIPGELIQIDFAVIEVEPNKYIKQFDATCPITKFTVSQVYARATSITATNFLEYIQQQFPFPIKSIQVDGGSEFMGNFEEACHDEDIELFVLPPKSPEITGRLHQQTL